MFRGFELNSLDPAFVLRLLRGLEGHKQSLFAQVFQGEGVSSRSGDVPFIPSSFTLLSSDPSFQTKIAPGDAPQVIDLDTSSTSYRFDGKYAHKAEIHEMTIEDLERLDTVEDVVEYLGMVVQQFISAAFDIDGATVMKDSTVNATVSAQTAWSNSATADVWVDFDAADDEAGDANICWLGLDKARDLAATDVFKAEAGYNFNPTEGRAPMSLVADTIKTRYNYEEVVIGNTWYQDSNQAQTLSKKRIFNGVAWVGNSDHMMHVTRQDLERASTGFDDETGKASTWKQEYHDIARAEKSRGVIIDGA